MMTLKDKKVLTFDCYGTLIDWETGILNSLHSTFSTCSLTDEEILSLFAQTEHKIQNKNGEMRYADVLREVVKTMGASLSIDVTDQKAAEFGASIRMWKPFPDTVKALQNLSTHFQLVIVSNIDNDSIAATKKHLNINFFKTYTAQDIGSYKPDPKVFHHVFEDLEQHGYHKNEVLHIAESLYHDHVPAKKIGFDGVWIHRRYNKSGNGATPAVGKEWIPDYQFNDLSSFADWALK